MLHCPVGHELWSFVFLTFGLHWLMLPEVTDVFSCWLSVHRKHHNSTMWAATSRCIMWLIWREQNILIFDGVERAVLELKSIFVHSLLDMKCRKTKIR